MDIIINSHNEAKDDFLFHHTKTTDKDINAISKPETHSQFEVLYLIKGEIEYTIEGVVYSVKENDVIIVPPNEIHSLKVKNSLEYERIVILFNFSTIKSMLKSANIFIDKEVFTNNNLYRVIPKELVEKSNLKNIIFETANLKDNPLIRVNLISHIMQLLCELHSIITLKSITPVTPINVNSVVKRTISYINANITKPLNLDTIAKDLGVSKSTICHQFSSFMKISINKYITIKKIYLAKSLIKKGMPITEVSLAVGYEQYTTFYQNYCKILGHSPSTSKPQ